jgi:monothiol glutaredoxin
MKGEPHAPMCGFSARVCRILDHAGVVYGSRNVLEDMSIREGIKQYT